MKKQYQPLSVFLFVYVPCFLIWLMGFVIKTVPSELLGINNIYRNVGFFAATAIGWFGTFMFVKSLKWLDLNYRVRLGIRIQVLGIASIWTVVTLILS